MSVLEQPVERRCSTRRTFMARVSARRWTACVCGVVVECSRRVGCALVIASWSCGGVERTVQVQPVCAGEDAGRITACQPQRGARRGRAVGVSRRSTCVQGVGDVRVGRRALGACLGLAGRGRRRVTRRSATARRAVPGSLVRVLVEPFEGCADVGVGGEPLVGFRRVRRVSAAGPSPVSSANRAALGVPTPVQARCRGAVASRIAGGGPASGARRDRARADSEVLGERLVAQPQGGLQRAR